jgi:hypothetical protein
MSIYECLSTYLCNDIKLPPKGAVYAPYIKVTINNEVLLMSGNESSPPGNNHAIITSFQYGASSGTGGAGCVIEAVDEGGIAYRKIADAINKDITQANNEVKKFNLEFGWQITYCNGITSKVTNQQGGGNGKPIRLLPIKINTNFDGGLIKFTLECLDLFAARSADNRLEKNIGSEDGKVSLKVALEQLFQSKDPKFTSVKLQRADGSDFVFNNDYGGPNGYWSVHNVDQETNVGCARKWINKTLTDNQKGILIMYDQEDGGVVLMEEPDYKDKDCCGSGKPNLGTYIVNGGNESPVISFNPSFEWILSSNSGSGGVASGASSSDGGEDKVKSKEEKGIQNTGVQTNYLSSNNKFHHETPDDHSSKTNKTHTKHNNATKPFEIRSNIEAELKIIGDPINFINPRLFTGRWVSIIVINPHYISKDSSEGGCSWLVESNCNQILSNKKWLLKGVDHQITSGSYVTTLKVYLTAPGINKPASEGIGCGGPKTSASYAQVAK